MVIYDELHAAPNRELYDVLSTSMGARAQPLMFVISTAGYDRHSILWELYAHAQKVRETPTARSDVSADSLRGADRGRLDESQGVEGGRTRRSGIFAASRRCEIAAARATEIPAQENNFRRLYLNQWTEQASRWLIARRRGTRASRRSIAPRSAAGAVTSGWI